MRNTKIVWSLAALTVMLLGIGVGEYAHLGSTSPQTPLTTAIRAVSPTVRPASPLPTQSEANRAAYDGGASNNPVRANRAAYHGGASNDGSRANRTVDGAGFPGSHHFNQPAIAACPDHRSCSISRYRPPPRFQRNTRTPAGAPKRRIPAHR